MGEMEHLSDTQSEKDERNIPIDRVGIKSLRFPVEVVERSGKVQSTVATAALGARAD